MKERARWVLAALTAEAEGFDVRLRTGGGPIRGCPTLAHDSAAEERGKNWTEV